MVPIQFVLRFQVLQSLVIRMDEKFFGLDDMNPTRYARDSRFVYGSSTEFRFEGGSIGARTVAESPFDKPANATR